MTQSKVNILLKGIFLIVVLAFVAVPNSGWAYNKSWDQGHKCVQSIPGKSGWCKWDYDGNPANCDAATPECCELLCKICPVYANSGRYQKTYTDLTVPGVGPTLAITRTYNSQEWSSSLFGYSWTFNFGRKLIITRNMYNEKIIGILLQTGENNYFREEFDGELIRLTGYGGKYEIIKNSDNTYTMNYLDGTVYDLREDGKIEKIVDRNHNALVFSYNSVGCISRITNASGNYVDFQLGPNGKISGVSDNLGRTIVYGYDDNGNLTSVTDPLGNKTQYLYNSTNFLTQITDARGNVVETATYDNNEPPRVSSFTERGETYIIAYFDGRTEKTDSQGNKWTYYFNDVGVIESVVDPFGNVKQQQLNKITSTSVDWEDDFNANRTTYNYYDNGEIKSKTDPLGNTWTYTYVEGTNWIDTETNPLGVMTKFIYDDEGNIIQSIRDYNGSLQNSITYSYDVKGSQTSVTDPLGNITNYDYNADGYLTRVTNSLGNSSSYTYDNRGNKLTETDENGNTNTYSYDLLDRMVAVTDPLGNTIKYAYDANGNLIEVDISDGKRINFSYDIYNRLVQITDPLGYCETYSYDHNNNLISITDSNDKKTHYEHDIYGRKTKEIDANGTVRLYKYDANGNMITLTDGNGNNTKFTYDANNRIINREYPDTSQINFVYNEIGIKVNEIDAENRLKAYKYDSLNRLIEIAYSDGDIAKFSYDALDRLITATNNSNNIVRTYDAIGRIITESQNEKEVNYTYDPAGNRTQMVIPGGLVISYSYDNANRMMQIKLPGNLGIEYTYDTLNRIVRKDYSGGSYTLYDFDDAGRTTGVSHLRSDGSIIYTQNNVFDKQKNILQKTTNFSERTYSYDNIYQLQSMVDNAGIQETYSYDNVGNRVTSEMYSNWTYNLRNQLTGYGSNTYQYDPNGNVITKDNGALITEYHYDCENRLKSINSNGVNVSLYDYDTKGRRTQKVYGSNTIKYIYDGEFLLGEYDQSWNPLRYYINGIWDFNPSIIYQNGSIYFVHHDALNTGKVVTDVNGSIVWIGNHDSFGKASVEVNDISYNFRLPGQYLDEESSLYYNGRRYYFPIVGRYMSEDPEKYDHKGMKENLYIYADNNPIIKLDPLGLRVQVCTKRLTIPAWVDAIGYATSPIIWAIFRAHAKHCNIKITSAGMSNWGFFSNTFDGPGWVTQNPSPIGSNCKDAIGVGNAEGCWDKCVNNAGASGGNTHYHFLQHNCCHWAKEKISSCGLKFPLPNVNWPVNPGY